MAEDMTSSVPDPEPWDDSTMDALALVASIRTDDIEGLAAILSHCALTEVAVNLGKMVAEVGEELRIAPGDLRRWGLAAVRRSS